MSNIYIQEPPTTAKVVMRTSIGDIDIELWTKEAPKACRNFIQLCMEGYYDNTIFHRIVKGFIVQGGDPTGTGEGGESIYGQPFKDEFHTRLRFCRRGLLAMANAGKDDNGSQFFFTFAPAPELQNKHTIFGKVTGETIYNMLKLEEALVDENDRPLYPAKIISTEILHNPFSDIVPRSTAKKVEIKETTVEKKTGVKNFNLLSFGEEAEEDEEESVVLNRQFSGKGKSAHDHSDPKLSSEPAVEPAGPPSKKKKEDRSSDWESGDEDETEEQKTAKAKEKEEMKERIKNKLKEAKKPDTKKAENIKMADTDVDKEAEEEEYYLGKDRDDERKKKAEAIRKEIRELKRGVQNEKKAKEAEKKQQAEKEEKKEKKTGIMKEYIENQEKYKEAKSKLPKKGKSREDFTMALLNKFRNKLQNAKDTIKDRSPSPDEREDKDKDDDDFDPSDESWMVHSLRCEEKPPVLAKDASTKDDDWFEIYDPRNPLNKRRRGEKGQKLKEEKGGKHSRH